MLTDMRFLFRFRCIKASNMDLINSCKWKKESKKQYEELHNTVSIMYYHKHINTTGFKRPTNKKIYSEHTGVIILEGRKQGM